MEEEEIEGDSLSIRPPGSLTGSLLILAEPLEISISSRISSSVSSCISSSQVIQPASFSNVH